jgi:Ni/Fe-hydrogenase subunit HybB-like protein
MTVADPLLLPTTDARLTQQILSTAWHPRGEWFWRLWMLSGLGTLVLGGAVTYTVAFGIGVWGNEIAVAWAFGIINFVWWIGIGHAGTFISAILYLFEQRWRASINRFSEAMTLFAVMQAGLFPLLHLGRPWFAYWLFPYPSTMQVWPQVKSALPWDAAAVSTYFTVSLLFWYLGLIPDLAAVRDTAPGLLRRRIYGLFALGWRGDENTWRHYRQAYLLLAGIATPLVLSVHSVVSSDFAIGLTPGWHSLIFPPYFVAGAIFSGFAMVLTLLVPVRSLFGMQEVITIRHLENCAKMVLTTGLMVSYGYLIEYFLAWYSGDPTELYQFYVARPEGPSSIMFYFMLLGNVAAPQLLWFRRVRQNPWLLFVISLVINLGMWSERFVIIVIGLEREYMVTKWANYHPTWVDLTILGGTMCFFLFLFLTFLRLVPFISSTELKELRHELAHEAEHEPEPARGGLSHG